MRVTRGVYGLEPVRRPYAGTQAGGAAALPCALGSGGAETAGAARNARPGDGSHPSAAPFRYAAIHIDWIKGKRASRRKDTTAFYPEADVDDAAVAARRLRNHIPAAVMARGFCEWQGTQNCGCGKCGNCNGSCVPHVVLPAKEGRLGANKRAQPAGQVKVPMLSPNLMF